MKVIAASPFRSRDSPVILCISASKYASGSMKSAFVGWYRRMEPTTPKIFTKCPDLASEIELQNHGDSRQLMWIDKADEIKSSYCFLHFLFLTYAKSYHRKSPVLLIPEQLVECAADGMKRSPNHASRLHGVGFPATPPVHVTPPSHGSSPNLQPGPVFLCETVATKR